MEISRGPKSCRVSAQRFFPSPENGHILKLLSLYHPNEGLKMHDIVSAIIF